MQSWMHVDDHNSTTEAEDWTLLIGVKCVQTIGA